MTFRPYSVLTSSAIEDKRPNNTGASILKGTPVRINNLGELDFIDVSIESQATGIAGIAKETIINGASGSFLSNGKIEDITTTANFGDLLYVDKTGNLTNIKPSIGSNGFVSGDFVLSVGVVAKNINNASLKDLIINVDLIGQL